MSKHRNAGLTPFQTVPIFSQKMSAVSLQASFHLHDCRNDRVWKNGLGSILKKRYLVSDFIASVF